MDVLVATVNRITFRSEETGYTVLRADTDSPLPVTVVGSFSTVSPGETLRLLGEWTTHPQYGRQFKMASYQQVTPATVNGIKKYLGSGLIKGIGPATAEKLVDHFGDSVLEVIENHPERLKEVEGIGEQKATTISQALSQQREVQEVMVFLQGHGVNPALANRIYKAYGTDSIKLVQQNPYRLANEIFGVGFLSADKIALSLGLNPDAEERIRAGLRYALEKAANEGHTYLPLSRLIEDSAQILNTEDRLVEKCVAMEDGHSIHIERNGSEPLIYLRPLYFAERGVSDRLSDLTVSVGQELIEPDIAGEIEAIEAQMGISLASNQLKAVMAAYQNGVCVITGGPGTGKTTIIRAIVSLFRNRAMTVALAAPTGRAAKRLSEATGQEAKTIHRLLEYTFGEHGMAFERNQDAPLNYDVVVIDEASMIDTVLAHSLLKSIKAGTRLILVGDVDQLPSVGAGRILEDIIDSGVIRVVRLNEIFRQAQESLIVVNAHKVNKGEIPSSSGKDGDFFFIEESDSEKIAETVLGLVSHRLPDYVGCTPNDINVLTPVKRGSLGTITLNQRLQEMINPATGPTVKAAGTVFSIGDKVMQIRNNYQKDVYNGDLGIIVGIEPEEREVTVSFGDLPGEKHVRYDPAELDELVLAYAVSVHKSQGSEYPVVVMPISWVMPSLMSRNLLYTAITRAKKMVVLVGDKRALKTYVENAKTEERFTGLADRLRLAFDACRK